jgi:hypothetical protein
MRNYLILYSMKRCVQLLFRHFVRIAHVRSTVEPTLPLLQNWTSLEGGLLSSRCDSYFSRTSITREGQLSAYRLYFFLPSVPCASVNTVRRDMLSPNLSDNHFIH